jgi:hypothetical protein
MKSQFGFDVFTMGTPGLDNQTLDSLELGYTGEFLQGRLRVGLDFALNWYDDLIWTVFDADNVGTINVGGAQIPNLSELGDYYGNVSGNHGHNLELTVTVLPSERTRLFGSLGYRQLFESKTGAFLDREPVWHLVCGVDLTSPDGFSVSFRGFFLDSHDRAIADPTSMLAPAIRQRVRANFLLNARVAWQVDIGALKASTGVEIFNLPGARSREFAGVRLPNRPDFGGERLHRKLVFFFQGEI